MDGIVKTPWDSSVFGIQTFEIENLSEKTLNAILKNPGHYTAKVNPLDSKKLLHEYGFYYCDTLLEPFCIVNRLVVYESKEVDIKADGSLEDLIDISHGAFIYGRFYRDFNLNIELAKIRYTRWLEQLYHDNSVFTLIHNNKVAGFFAYSSNKIILHALSSEFRNRRLAKYFWSAACKRLFGMGHKEIYTSISATNLAILNLYTSLGFKFRNPVDVYHKLVDRN